MRTYRLGCAFLFLLIFSSNLDAGVQIKAKLLSPISSKTSQPGDHFTAQVQEPQNISGAIVEGLITSLDKAQRGVRKPKASISFQFETITVNNQTSNISADLQAVTNSKGLNNVDDEGHLISKSSNKKRIATALLFSAAGAAIGAAADGAKGATEGAAGGAAAGLIVALTLTTKSSDIELQPGAILTLNINSGQRQRQSTRAEIIPKASFSRLDQTFRGSGFEFEYPGNWEIAQIRSDTQLTALSPKGGMFKNQRGSVEVGVGVMFGYFLLHRPKTLVTATQDFVQQMLSINRDAQVIDGGTRDAKLAGYTALVTQLVGPSHFSEIKERDTIFTVLRPQGLFYVIVVAPENEPRDAFDQITSSLRFTE